MNFWRLSRLSWSGHESQPRHHRQVVLTISKRLREGFLHDRRRRGLFSRVASRTLHAYVRAALGKAVAVPGVISLAQSFGSLAHSHPHLHLVMTDGAFRRDGSFVAITVHDAGVLTEAWRRAVLARFMRQGWLEEDAGASMLSWPRSGFSAHVGRRIEPEDRASVLRVARYGASAPRWSSCQTRARARFAGAHRFAALEFLARLRERDTRSATPRACLICPLSEVRYRAAARPRSSDG